MALASLALLAASPAKADNTTQQPAAAPAPATVALPMPQMAGPLGLDTTPFSFGAGRLGRIYVTGAVTGMAMTQDHPVTGDKISHVDFTNGQIFIQNTTGPVQFFLQAGGYTLPALGTAYLSAHRTTTETYGYLPQGYLKFAPTDSFSLMAGKLPTLLGDEYTFTFQNIERGLLWNQENAVNRGVQGNYTVGPLAVSLSLNDGFYSNHYSWVTGLATYTIDTNNSFAVAGGGNFNHSSRSTVATPEIQNNSSIYNVMYTHTDGPWTFNPYIQYTHVPIDKSIGILGAASSYGAAFLTKYSFDANFSLAARAEYIDSIGNAADRSSNLLYGPGSRAWSLTLTPTYQVNMFFGRLDASYVHAFRITDGDAFGVTGDEKAQGRLMLETGVMF